MSLSIEQAQDLVSHVVANKVRWGKMYNGDDLGLEKILDALIVIAQSDSHEVAEVRKGLATANRQVGAHKAREAKLTKQIEGLKNEVANLNALVERLSDSDGSSEEGVG
jgi:septal ring factor EnvC (AmiA/AmiB activator)